ncbi:MAG: amidohydrolase, partial [Lentisphaeria bacterium]|nr:amidohydrolase [Lentisphaeria bacterium]
MDLKFLSAIDRKQDELIKLADTVWENPEILFKEFKSSAAVMDYLSANGFTIEKNVAGLPTSFIASYGSGHPEIGFIAEYDAIANQSQKAGSTEPEKD